MTITSHPTSAHSGVRRITLRFAYLGLILSLIGLNARWIWKDRQTFDLTIADGFLKKGRLSDAEQTLQELVDRSRWNGEAMMKLSRLLAKRGDYLGCARVLHKVPDWWPAKPDAIFIEAQSFKQLDMMREAEVAWKRCLVGDPLHPFPPRYLSGAARELVGHLVLEGRIDEARELLMKAFDLALPSERGDVMIMRMRAELERVAHKEAASRLRTIVKADPDDWEARRALAFEEQLLGNLAAADLEIGACLKARPSDVPIWRTYLEILYQRGERDEIRAAIKRLPPLADADADAEILKFRGLVHEWDTDLQSAVDAFQRATELNPREPEYFYKLGILQERLGRSEVATQHLQHSRQLRKADSELSDAYEKLLALSQHLQAGNPEYDAAVEHLASLCEQLGWKREAVAWRRVIGAG